MKRVLSTRLQPNTASMYGASSRTRYGMSLRIISEWMRAKCGRERLNVFQRISYPQKNETRGRMRGNVNKHRAERCSILPTMGSLAICAGGPALLCAIFCAMAKLSETLQERGYVHQFSSENLSLITDGPKRTVYLGI